MNTAAITIKGKPYIQVAGRVSLAHEDEGFSMISSDAFELANRYFVRVTITVKDKQYIGTSEVKFTDKGGTADGDSPVECAETSALGRALGYAGYGSVESIASADEVLRNEQQHTVSDADELKAIMAACKSIGIAKDTASWQDWKLSVLHYQVANKLLKHGEIVQLREALEEHKQAFIAGAA